jgi:hypothetical protein
MCITGPNTLVCSYPIKQALIEIDRSSFRVAI